MAEMIILAGKTGSGKTTSFEKLPPQNTLILTATGKRLSIQGFQRFYCKDTLEMMNWVKKGADNPKVKYIILDDLMFDSVDKLFTKVKEKGFDKWTDLAYFIFMLIKTIESIQREDLIVILVQHMDILDSGQKVIKCVSKMVREQLPIEGYVNIVVESFKEDGEHKFLLKSYDDTDIAKSPKGMFDEPIIDNDMLTVVEGVKRFYGIDQKKVKINL